MDELSKLHSEEMERAALGCMLMDKEAAELGKSLLAAEDFYTPMYRAIFCAMQALEVVDAFTVSDELKRRKDGAGIGIDRLADILTAVSTSVHLRGYIESLKRLSFLRRMLQGARDMTAAVLRQDIGGIEKCLTAMRGDSCGCGLRTKRKSTSARLRHCGKAAGKSLGCRQASLTLT